MSTYPLAILGAGPVGLAAAAHAVERGLEPIVLEQGPAVGHAVRQWAHVSMFSNWAYDIDAAAGRLLDRAGWNRPDPDAFPTGGDIVTRYLEPLAARTPVGRHIRLDTHVLSVGRVGLDKAKTFGRAAAPFEIITRNGGRERRVHARAVIDATGTWFHPNPAGAGGTPALGESAAATRIAQGMPDVLGAARERYAGRRVAVLGGGHSAVGTLIELAKLAHESPGTTVTWLYRGANPRKAFGGGDKDGFAERGALGVRLAALVASGAVTVEAESRVSAIETTAHGIAVVSGSGRARREVAVDELVVATGFRPGLDMLRELRIDLDPALECPPALAPLIDPNVHSCGTVRPHGAAELAHTEPGFYIAGMKSYGRAPTFLLATGHEQVRSIVAAIAGDDEAARRVELVLPETGVCAGPAPAREQACCGGPPVADASACCVQDERAKVTGRAGCGCS